GKTRHDMTNEVIVLSGATRQARTSPWLPVRSVRVAPKRRPPASRIAPTSTSVRRLPLRLNWLVLVISCTARVRSPHARSWIVRVIFRSWRKRVRSAPWRSLGTIPSRRRRYISVRSRSSEVVARRENRLETRSEEHTSELQSRVELVCRLLLEKK